MKVCVNLVSIIFHFARICNIFCFCFLPRSIASISFKLINSLLLIMIMRYHLFIPSKIVFASNCVNKRPSARTWKHSRSRFSRLKLTRCSYSGSSAAHFSITLLYNILFTHTHVHMYIRVTVFMSNHILHTWNVP